MKDCIYFNGNIMTMTGEGDTVEAVLISQGKIKACGSMEHLLDCSPAAECIDLQGKTMMPSFIDPHSHFATIGKLAVASVDLVGSKDFDDIVERIRTFIEKNHIPEGKMVSGRGYDHNELKEKTHPTKDVLDRASDKHCIMISHVSGHIGSVNTMALERAGITNDSEYGEGGVICRDEQGNINGHLEEDAFFAMRQFEEQPTKEQEKEFILAGQKIYAQYGVTTVQQGGSGPEMTEWLMELAEEGKLTLDVVNYMMLKNTSEHFIKDHEKYAKKYYNHLKCGGYKLFLDGSPQCKTAWMSQPYEGETEYCGYPIIHNEEALKYVQRVIDEEQQLLVHCNGDQASEQFIASYENAVDTHGTKKQLRPVMIHCQTVRDDQLDRMVEIGMIPSIFVGHTYFWGDVHLKNFGPVRGNHISPAKAALERGLKINFHQDSPVTPPNMLFSIWCAVNRITKSGVVIGEDQKISVYEALKAGTIGGAYEYFEENEKGTIEVGKCADLVVLSEDPMAVDPMKIKDIQVLKTMKDGEVIFYGE